MTFATGQSCEMGRYEDPLEESLPSWYSRLTDTREKEWTTQSTDLTM